MDENEEWKRLHNKELHKLFHSLDNMLDENQKSQVGRAYGQNEGR